MPTLSIIIPVYNVEEHIRKCVDSIVVNKSSAIEIILVDDGSSDKSGAICDQIAETDSRVTVIHKKNGGVSKARNTGLAVTKGKYIGFVDSDDYVTENYVDSLIELLNTESPDIIQFGVERVSTRNAYTICPEKSRLYQNSNNYILKEHYSHGVWSYAFKAELIEKNKIRFPEDIPFSEDQAFIARCFLKSHSIKAINRCLYYYIDRFNSAVNSNKKHERAYCNLLVFNDLLRFHKDNELNATAFSRSILKNLFFDYFLYLKRFNILKKEFIKEDLNVIVNSDYLKTFSRKLHILYATATVYPVEFALYSQAVRKIDRTIRSIKKRVHRLY
ncbi:glycosyltransferase [Mangrovibacterium diazotrophicum]|uniref:Glycosyltransferase involved in cell wall biosynthesis n=1 Tax=Mangrovibacterium diazotrophicum TaxID=1261403 RepID=A0A419W945_9BACT|nr:glycosyltransferase [Mangrovibacterium diazotrophicum]RKD91998.1 glycosyltransferase involved in cell wall biosynthesis [Mangrovibacterium diazotrophicum]